MTEEAPKIRRPRGRKGTPPAGGVKIQNPTMNERMMEIAKIAITNQLRDAVSNLKETHESVLIMVMNGDQVFYDAWGNVQTMTNLRDFLTHEIAAAAKGRPEGEV